MAVELVLLAAVLAVLVLAMSGRWRKPAILVDGAILPPERTQGPCGQAGQSCIAWHPAGAAAL